MARMKESRCPECLSALAAAEMHFTHSFVCPSCGTELEVDRHYVSMLKTLSFALGWATAICAFGFESPLLIVLTVISSVVFHGFWSFVLMFVLPAIHAPGAKHLIQSPKSTLGIGHDLKAGVSDRIRESQE